MVDEIVWLLQKQQEEVKKLLNQHYHEIVALIIKMKEESVK